MRRNYLQVFIVRINIFIVMKPLLALVIATTICIINSCSYKIESEYPRGTAKIIEETYFYPVNNNGKWECGDTIISYKYDKANHKSYYDKYGNIILSKEKRLIGTEISTTYYRKPKQHIKERTHVYNTYTQKSYDKIYVYDKNKNLVEVTKSRDSVLSLISKYDYNEEGDLIKKMDVEEEYVMYITPLNQYEAEYIKYNLDGVLLEKGKEKYDDKGLITYCHIDAYNFGQYHHSTEDCYYFYDKDGRILSYIVEKKVVAKVFSAEYDIKWNDDAYFIKKYYQTEPSIDDGFRRFWEYNENGDCIAERLVNEDNTINVDSIKEYEYNEKGDWIKCTVYNRGTHKLCPDGGVLFNLTKEEDTPSEIIVRNIENI